MMEKIIFPTVFCVALFFFSPLSHGKSYKKLVWQTEGGGQIHFEVTPPAQPGGVFVLYLASSGFREINKKSFLSQKQDPVLYARLVKIFDGKIDTHPPKKAAKNKSDQPEVPTGTWTSVFLVDENGKKERVWSALGIESLFNYLPAATQ